MKTPHQNPFIISRIICHATIGTLLAGLFFARVDTAPAQPAFGYAPVTNAILNATLSINFAELVANPTVGGTTVNSLRLWDTAGVQFLDLSGALFGTAAWPSPPLINQGTLQTGFFTANIRPSFFPVLASGGVGLTAQLTDTADGVFALDTNAPANCAFYRAGPH